MATLDTASDRKSLKPIQGESGLPFFGNTFRVISNPEKFGREMREKYGDIYSNKAFFIEAVNLVSPEGAELILMDKQKSFSSEGGWNHWLGKLFPKGLMLMDFDQHKAHRHIMNVAFKTPAMKRYCEEMNKKIPQRIAQWGEEGKIHFYPAIKQLSLDLATDVFLGIDEDEDKSKINKALTDMVTAAVGVVRYAIPGTKMYKGVKGREYMVNFMRERIPYRRKSNGSDIFTIMCQAEDDEGNKFTDDEIIDHMLFLWMAAHDTITSSVTTLIYELARHPDWQTKVRDEIMDVGFENGAMPYENLNKLVLNEYAFKEALRINPPVPSIVRYSTKDVVFDGHLIPKGTYLALNTVAIHRDAKTWPNPMEFDPMRFSPEGGAKERHRFAWIPFSGGAHMCIGLHFAYMQAKIISSHLLKDYKISVPEGYSTEFQIIPLIKPLDNLPITLEKI